MKSFLVVQNSYIWLPKLFFMTFKLNILTQAQKVTSDSLRRNRRYVYVALLIIAACITESPSGKEQALITLPLILLYELSILLMDNFKK